jgi:hypothetical protein
MPKMYSTPSFPRHRTKVAKEVADRGAHREASTSEAYAGGQSMKARQGDRRKRQRLGVPDETNGLLPQGLDDAPPPARWIEMLRFARKTNANVRSVGDADVARL